MEQRLQWLLRENGPAAAASDGGDEAATPVRRRRVPRAAPAPRALSVVGSFRRPHVVIVAAIVMLGILLAGWALLRAKPVAVAVTPPVVPSPASGPGSGPASGGEAPATPGPSASAAGVLVHVLGAVKKPGVVRLTAGSRVQDALQKAGGLTGKADPGELNLAQPVADGQQIVVGTKGKPTGEVRDGSGGTGGGGATGSGGAPGSGAGQQPVNLNTATQAQLEELPGVGPVMAGKIIAWRTENGRFSRVEELQEISGVGPKTYARLAPLCRV